MRTDSPAPRTAAGRLDLVSNLAAPLFIGHRGANLLFPEHSMEGYRAVADAGFPPEPDVRALADGTLVCVHDETAERTMRGATGEVALLTRREWSNARIKPGPGGDADARPALFDEVLDELGGEVLLVPEIKVYDHENVTTFISAIVDRGLTRAVLVQSFDYDVAQRLADAGMSTLLLVDAHALPDSFENIRATGIEYVGSSISTASSVIDRAAQEGLRTIVWTVNTRWEALEVVEMGAFGVFSDDVWAAAGQAGPTPLGI